ncbi:cytochrome P450 [Trichodelitschia bisporula]|uniref:Cytochrome P450 n=1 Tax=Trichodelitschia bisporula TaxID=703511 RepID=A0A6G1HYX7_9PEZI|nr:cytochrome P450 [Trichodelitschia bisporula]
MLQLTPLSVVSFGLFLLYRFIYVPLFYDPLSRIPGPWSFAISKWRLAYEEWKGTRTQTIHRLHARYGPAVRIGPAEVAFNSLAALRTIYGAGSGFERTSFYDMFDVYGKKNLFTFHSSKDHGDRKKLLAHAYSKSVIVKGSVARGIEEKVRQFIDLIQRDPVCASEIFTSLHYFALDTISDFLYGDIGKTTCLLGCGEDRALLDDIMNIERRKLSWFAVHFPKFTGWLYSRTGALEMLLQPFYPMRKPTTYTGIRKHGLRAWEAFSASSAQSKLDPAVRSTIIGKLWEHHESHKNGGLSDLDTASECADHLLAGIDTTSDTLMFLIWALSRSENRIYQERLIQEVRGIPTAVLNVDGIPSVEPCGRLPYLDAVIKETLRLYAPLPSSEPRSFHAATTIDGYHIPKGTIVSMAPYSLHRNPLVFTDPLKFNPERWLAPASETADMKKWWWAFSSGGRMCIGMHLALAEMTTLVSAIYRNYHTTINQRLKHTTPGITSRFEVFYDETLPVMREHECRIGFHPRCMAPIPSKC